MKFRTAIALTFLCAHSEAALINYDIGPTSSLHYIEQSRPADTLSGSYSFNTDTLQLESLSVRAANVSLDLTSSSHAFTFNPSDCTNVNWAVGASASLNYLANGEQDSGFAYFDFIPKNGSACSQVLASGLSYFYVYASLPTYGAVEFIVAGIVTPPTSEEPGAEVPEPASIALLGLGLAGLVRLRRQQLPNLV